MSAWLQQNLTRQTSHSASQKLQSKFKLQENDKWQQRIEAAVPREHSGNSERSGHRRRTRATESTEKEKLTVRRTIDRVGLRAIFLFLWILTEMRGGGGGGKGVGRVLPGWHSDSGTRFLSIVRTSPDRMT